MIKLERFEVMNFENAMRGARNPMNSWARSDSFYDESGNFVFGPNDLDLAKRLCAAGSDHREFVRMIFVSVDITAPLYWWKEFDTYKVGTVANSTSTMHKIHSKEFSREDFSFDKLDERSLHVADTLIDFMEELRKEYVETKVLVLKTIQECKGLGSLQQHYQIGCVLQCTHQGCRRPFVQTFLQCHRC